MKNLKKYFKALPLFLLSSLFIIFSPKQDIYIKLIITLIFHEMGHLFFMSLFNIKINYFRLSILGGTIDTKMNLAIIPEIIIYLGGIIFNIITLLFPHLYYYSLILIIFNLLPIYPLDGFNIYKRVLAYFINYHMVLYISYIFSIIICIILIIISIIYFNALIIINILYSLILSINGLKNINQEYYSFIIDKYLTNDNKRIKFLYRYIKYPFYKYHRSIIYDNSRIITDREILDYRFAIKEK